MTRKEALAELIEKVEAGNADGRCRLTAKAFSQSVPHSFVWAAMDGSLDAAKALHEAVLPETGWDIFKTGEYPGMIPGSSAYMFAARVGYGTTYRGDDDNPARAWLIAILRALHAQDP